MTTVNFGQEIRNSEIKRAANVRFKDMVPISMMKSLARANVLDMDEDDMDAAQQLFDAVSAFYDPKFKYTRGESVDLINENEADDLNPEIAKIINAIRSFDQASASSSALNSLTNRMKGGYFDLSLHMVTKTETREAAQSGEWDKILHKLIRRMATSVGRSVAILLLHKGIAHNMTQEYYNDPKEGRGGIVRVELNLREDDNEFLFYSDENAQNTFKKYMNRKTRGNASLDNNAWKFVFLVYVVKPTDTTPYRVYVSFVPNEQTEFQDFILGGVRRHIGNVIKIVPTMAAYKKDGTPQRYNTTGVEILYWEQVGKLGMHIYRTLLDSTRAPGYPKLTASMVHRIWKHTEIATHGKGFAYFVFEGVEFVRQSIKEELAKKKWSTHDWETMRPTVMKRMLRRISAFHPKSPGTGNVLTHMDKDVEMPEPFDDERGMKGGECQFPLPAFVIAQLLLNVTDGNDEGIPDQFMGGPDDDDESEGSDPVTTAFSAFIGKKDKNSHFGTSDQFKRSATVNKNTADVRSREKPWIRFDDLDKASYFKPLINAIMTTKLADMDESGRVRVDSSLEAAEVIHAMFLYFGMAALLRYCNTKKFAKAMHFLHEDRALEFSSSLTHEIRPTLWEVVCMGMGRHDAIPTMHDVKSQSCSAFQIFDSQVLSMAWNHANTNTDGESEYRIHCVRAFLFFMCDSNSFIAKDSLMRTLEEWYTTPEQDNLNTRKMEQSEMKGQPWAYRNVSGVLRENRRLMPSAPRYDLARKQPEDFTRPRNPKRARSNAELNEVTGRMGHKRILAPANKPHLLDSHQEQEARKKLASTESKIAKLNGTLKETEKILKESLDRNVELEEAAKRKGAPVPTTQKVDTTPLTNEIASLKAKLTEAEREKNDLREQLDDQMTTIQELFNVQEKTIKEKEQLSATLHTITQQLTEEMKKPTRNKELEAQLSNQIAELKTNLAQSNHALSTTQQQLAQLGATNAGLQGQVSEAYTAATLHQQNAQQAHQHLQNVVSQQRTAAEIHSTNPVTLNAALNLFDDVIRQSFGPTFDWGEVVANINAQHPEYVSAVYENLKSFARKAGMDGTVVPALSNSVILENPDIDCRESMAFSMISAIRYMANDAALRESFSNAAQKEFHQKASLAGLECVMRLDGLAELTVLDKAIVTLTYFCNLMFMEGKTQIDAVAATIHGNSQMNLVVNAMLQSTTTYINQLPSNRALVWGTIAEYHEHVTNQLNALNQMDAMIANNRPHVQEDETPVQPSAPVASGPGRFRTLVERFTNNPFAD